MRRGLVPTLELAQAAVSAGRVLVDGAPAVKASRLVAAGEPLTIVGPPPRFVSRGGLKLDAAVDRFALDVSRRRCLDAGASTGGFTDCLLQRWALEVVAGDVGFVQLHERLRRDPRVRLHERTNVRRLDVGDVDGSVELLVADLSFISLRTVLPALLALVRPGGDLVLLVKPQFEAGRREVSKGAGVVRDPAVWRRVLTEVVTAVVRGGADTMGVMASPLTGADGNVEFLLWARRSDGPGLGTELAPAALDAVIAEVAEASGRGRD
ncbi:16S/23S rRNA (cytidine-2'-O)-methyltransferase TlyA [soil metagenome]